MRNERIERGERAAVLARRIWQCGISSMITVALTRSSGDRGSTLAAVQEGAMRCLASAADVGAIPAGVVSEAVIRLSCKHAVGLPNTAGSGAMESCLVAWPFATQ